MKKQLNIYFGLLLFLFCSNVNDASGNDEILLNSTISGEKFLLGDKIELKFILAYPPNMKFIEQNISENLGNLEVFSTSIIDTNDLIRPKNKNTIFTIILIGFDEGIFTIPPLTFIFEDINTNRIFTKISEEFQITIETINLGENPQLKEIPVKFLPEKEINILNIVIVGFTVVVLVLVVILLRRKVKKLRKTQNN